MNERTEQLVISAAAAPVPQLVFEVLGTPIPKGSKRLGTHKRKDGTTGTHVIEDSAKTMPWVEAVAWAATAAIARTGWQRLLDCPVELRVTFYLPRPKTAKRSYVAPWKKPDGDKLVRAIKDALTRAGVYGDDSQVTDMIVRKRFAGYPPCDAPGRLPRAEIAVWSTPL